MVGTQPSQKLGICLEVCAVVAAAIVSKLLLDQVFWRFSGPVSLIALLALLTIYLRGKGINWTDLGLRLPAGRRGWLLLLPQALLAVFAILLAGAGTALVGAALGFDFMAEVPDGVDERWGDVAGNMPRYLMWLSIGILSGGFAEEMFFRSYLISRLREGFGGGRIAAVLAVLLSAAFFGYGHVYYQGLKGFITTGAIGLALGFLYLLYRRNLWPLIVAHAFVDSLAFTATYAGWDI
ncbi:MAG TPA: CPBP family intramembrane metalloprotease [Hyphomonas sp.]|nr:CPBP family intramembrane metalloprotease [Hyphomonas sp.]